jgi:uncharacterized protein
MGRQRVSWHETKREAVFEERGIEFADLEPFFDDPQALIRSDSRRDDGEERYNMLASFAGVVLNITYTPRTDRFRIISARMANRKERELYARKRTP